MVERRWFFICGIVILLSNGTSAAIHHNQTAMRRLSQAFGFVVAQDYTLDRIVATYPDMRGDVEVGRLQFFTSFPDIADKLEAELTNELGADQVKTLKEELLAQLRARFGDRPSRDQAVAFLKEVGLRAKGQIVAPVLQYLLAVRYTESPVAEFLDGWRQRFSTEGNAKARGVKLRFQLPLSWVPSDDEDPLVIQAWSSEGGTGLEVLTLTITDGKGYEPSANDIRKAIESGDVKRTLPAGATYINAGPFSLDVHYGYWVDMRFASERAGLTIHQRTRYYQWFSGRYGIGLGCAAVKPAAAAASLDAAFTRVEALCQQVANSVFLENSPK